ncbi:MAG: hypothetical protein QG649_702 [Patescibacteria group bacterium]|nr:hypothetical protein [Patescibacteria group bacterium]
MPGEKIKSYVQQREQRAEEAQLDYETAPDRPLDDLKTDASEILGEKTGFLRGSYRSVADNLEARASIAETKVDIQSTREKFLEYRSNAAQNKMNRINERIANSSDGFLAKQINRQRRQSVDKLSYKKGIRDQHIAKLAERRQKKPEELRKQIDKLVDQKIKAVERKAQRVVMRREKGIKPHQVAKKAEFLAKLTPEQKAKIVRESILQVRKQNIKKGALDVSYQIDDTLETRQIGDHYGRTTE